MNVKADSLQKGSSKKAQKGQQQRNQMIILGIVGGAVALALIFIVISLTSTTSNPDKYASLPWTQTADGAYVLGNPEAPITIVEFADFLCPACQQYKPELDRFIDEYVMTGRARFEYRTLVTAGGARTEQAAKLLECSATLQPGSFFPGYEVMYEFAMSGRLNDNVSRAFAERMGLNLNELLTCTRNANQVNIDQRLAASLGATSTPSVFVRYGDSQPQPVANRSFAGLSQLVRAVNP